MQLLTDEVGKVDMKRETALMKAGSNAKIANLLIQEAGIVNKSGYTAMVKAFEHDLSGAVPVHLLEAGIRN